MNWKQTIAVSLALVLSTFLLSEAQRSQVFSSVNITGTSASALAVGCIPGSSACTGGVLAGPGTFAGTVAISGTTNLPTTTIANQLYCTAGYTTPDAVKCYFGDASGWTLQYVTRSASVDSSFYKLYDYGRVDTARIDAQGIQNATTTSGAQSITLNLATSLLRVTTGGSASDDLLDHLTGGSGGRRVTVCWIAESSAGDGVLSIENGSGGTTSDIIITPGGASAPLALGGCAELMYDGTSSRWRYVVGN